jgi:hypothetical protein
LATVAALFATSSVYWLVVVLLPGVGVSPIAWLTLFLACVCASLLVARLQPLAPRTWLYFATCSVLLAAFFFGANLGLDALHGAERPKANVAATLGGLELWFVLCPGVTSVALAAWAVGLVAKHLSKGKARNAQNAP